MCWTLFLQVCQARIYNSQEVLSLSWFHTMLKKKRQIDEKNEKKKNTSLPSVARRSQKHTEIIRLLNHFMLFQNPEGFRIKKWHVPGGEFFLYFSETFFEKIDTNSFPMTLSWVWVWCRCSWCRSWTRCRPRGSD